MSMKMSSMRKHKLIAAVLGVALIAAAAVFSAVMTTGCTMQTITPSTTQVTAQAQATNETAAMTDTPVPSLSYFVERRTIARWAEYWDKPSVVTYVYCVSFGKVMGYYVCSGRPASTRSYITPETKFEHVDVGEFYGDVLVEAPDIDGTYGDNNPGIRGFTASGIAFEWAGYGATHMISSAPLPFDAPCLGK